MGNSEHQKKREEEEGEQELRDAEHYIQNKNVVAMWFLIATQILFCVMSMFLKFDENEQAYRSTAVQDFLQTGLMLILIIVGFGLMMGYSHRLIWSSIGFNLLITAICVQLYFFINVFWVKAQLQQYDRRFTTREQNYLHVTGSSEYGNLNEGIKCSLAIIVAFSSIIGRAGILQAYFMSIFGTIVYELSRQVCTKVTDYEIGSAKIFLLGGAFGAACSIWINRSEKSIKRNLNMAPDTNSSTLSLLGLIMVWALFPLLVRDTPVSAVAQTTNSSVINIVLSLSASTVLSAGFAFIKIGFRGFIICSISGGVACLSSAPYISNPAYAIAFGLAAALVQFAMIIVFLGLREFFGPVDNGNFFVFLIQGAIGTTFLFVNKSIVNSNSDLLSYGWSDYHSYPKYGVAAAWISGGMGLLLGIMLGCCFCCCTVHDRVDHFIDDPYWKKGDRIQRASGVEKSSETRTEDIYIMENTSTIKEKHCYL